MNTAKKGNELEDRLFAYLQDQANKDGLVLGIYPDSLCQIYKKKKYYCRVRDRQVEFDLVVEVRRNSNSAPHVYIVIECKNHKGPIKERDVADFSSKIGDIFGHSVKGFLACSARLQSGAESFVKSNGIGVLKFDESGWEITIDRKGGLKIEQNFLRGQLFDADKTKKSLRFSAFSDGVFYGSLRQLMMSVDPDLSSSNEAFAGRGQDTVSFLPVEEIRSLADEVHRLINHTHGVVDLGRTCAALDLKLRFSHESKFDSEGSPVLGSANFNTRTIEINLNENKNRERFTLAHEVGHFYLNHEKYLISESIIESDLFIGFQSEERFNYSRLEHQANIFASEVLLPHQEFCRKLKEIRAKFGIQNKGFGYIFVDDQPCNYGPYNGLLSDLSNHFEASKIVIEVKLTKMGLLNDKRQASYKNVFSSIGLN